MAAPEEGGTEALPPPPPAEDEPPGEAAVCGAPLTVVAGAAARPAAEEEAEGAVGPVDPPPPAEGPELLAVTEELAQSLVALEAGAAAGTVLYLQADGSLVEGAGLSAEEQRRLLEQLLAAAESPGPGTAEPSPPPPRHAATPLAPAELLRVIEQVSKAQEQQKPPPAAPLEPCPGPPPCRGGGCPPPRDAGPVPPQACGAAPPRASIMHNAAQQLQSVAQQVALQQGKSMAAARLLPQKQLEAICVQVQPGQMKETERPMPSLAPIQSKTITLSQSVGRNSNIPGLGIINPQIIRIQPVTGTEQQQQLFLHSSSESPIQLLMQRPLPSHGSVSVNKIPTSKMLNGQKATRATVSPARSPNITMVAASSANTLIPCLEKNQKDDKLKKSLKVKTRSGRISRPPKYKAKDYKFIKMEDLADGHQSDSDDYSELSIEDEEEGKVKGKDALFSSSNYNLKPKMFKCQTCEKSYIGKGGLARHYKLNPGHGQLESSPQKVPLNKLNGSMFLDNTCRVREETMSPALDLDSIAVTLNNKNALATNLEEAVDSKAGEQTRKSAESRHMLAEQQNETSSGHRGPITPKGPGRPRRPKRRGRPRMGGRSRCSGRLSRPGQSPSKSLSSVSAEHNVFRRKARLKELIQQCDNEDLMELALPRLTKLVTVYEFLLMKSSGEELLPSAKRTKLEDLTENVNNAYASQDEVKEKSGNLCTLFEKDGFNPLNGEILLSEDRHITCGTTGSTLLTAEEHNSFADSGVRINAENSGTFSQTVKMRIEYSQPVNIQGPDMAGNTSLLHTEVVLPVEADGSPELVQAHFVSENSAGGLSAPKLCDSVLENAVGSHSTDLPTSEENGHNEKYQKLQEENRNFAVKEHSEQLHNADMTDEMQELEKVFATNIVPINYPHSAQTESRQNPVQESSLSAHVNHENSFKDVNAFSCGMEEQHELENTVTVDETVAFEITDESHDFLSQGHEQIFIQTSGGLILSHPDTAVLSQAEGIVIVTDSNGTTMHIRTPEGIPLETVEALLAMEADGQSEDILLSQSELEP
ncbi:zinc finger protein 839 isoform X4 [Balearica regulorum gibbericeps]|uniref:zinc finger protein 839 isoform X4 n=1 Tax=Balearica regulorum gibbericeps TaxID=100784 RepID=UPI003F5E92E4